MLPTEIKLCCKMLGTAITVSRRSRGKEKRRLFPLPGIFFSCKATVVRASTQLTPWHRNVAQATPATPILKAVTKRISIPILAREDTARNRKGVLLSPRAEKMPVEML